MAHEPKFKVGDIVINTTSPYDKRKSQVLEIFPCPNQYNKFKDVFLLLEENGDKELWFSEHFTKVGSINLELEHLDPKYKELFT